MEKVYLYVVWGLVLRCLDFMFGVNTEHIIYIKSLLFLMFIDLLVGVIKSRSLGQFKKRELFVGIGRKILEFVMIAVAFQIDKTGVFGSELELEHIAVYSYLVYEFYSIKSNLKLIGVCVPDNLDRR